MKTYTYKNPHIAGIPACLPIQVVNVASLCEWDLVLNVAF